jgi:hypothetical protein
MRLKREAWSQLVARWESSGESAAEFASRIGTSAMTLYRWRHEVRKTAARKPEPTLGKIVEVRPALLAGYDRFEIRLTDGRCIGVPPSFDAASLERLLRVLETAA